MKYRYFFFDFDGMLADSYDHITNALIKTLKESRNIDISFDEMFELCKISMGNAFRHFEFTSEEKDLFLSYELDINFKPLVKPFKETKPLIEAIYKQGGEIYLYTNRTHLIDEYLTKFEIKKYFKGCINTANKPDSTKLIETIDSIKASKNECIVLGDRKLDVTSAFNANVDSLLFDRYHIVEDCNQTYRVESLNEIYKLLDIEHC